MKRRGKEEIATLFPGPSFTRSPEKREHWEAGWKEQMAFTVRHQIVKSK